ncbi:hypothetical protein PMAYCL1PPCAC_03124, partial [Pristionchus mayeri]
MARFLILLSTAVHLVSATLVGELSKELIKEGLVSIDENGIPKTSCMVLLSNGTSTPQECPVIPGFGPQGVGCFALWNADRLIEQGCFSRQEISLRNQCKKKTCHSRRKQKDVSFCCCHGPLCNGKFTQ